MGCNPDAIPATDLCRGHGDMVDRNLAVMPSVESTVDGVLH